ncbi:unnamed protein product [Scytosiphon promiscuus]
MGINGQTKSYLSAVIMLLAAALQVCVEMVSLTVIQRTHVTCSCVSSARGVVKMELSPYEEYMASSGWKGSCPGDLMALAAKKGALMLTVAPISETVGVRWRRFPRPVDARSHRAPFFFARMLAHQPPYSLLRFVSPRSVLQGPDLASCRFCPRLFSRPPMFVDRLFRQKNAGEKHIGTGGMADTRDPAPVNHEDPRKSISAAPSFEEYLKSKRN